MDLKDIQIKSQQELSEVKTEQDLEKWQIKYLGKKSEISLSRKELSQLSIEQRKQRGKEIYEAQIKIDSYFQDKKKEIESQNSVSQNNFDLTQPGKKIFQGHFHPTTLITNQIINSFEKLGFLLVEGPDIETEYYNFDALNIPTDHPARDMWDTLWLNPQSQNSKVKSQKLLRTHTSPMQIRYMEKNKPPFRIIVPGRCFRHEATDATHEIQFHQIEGLMISEKVSLTNFKAIITEIIKEIFKEDKNIELRFRPSYFPFVSPGIEVDIKINSGKMKNKWLEIMGAGMVHPLLFKNVGYELNQWQGFAFGLGVERIAMIKYDINDIRLCFNPDIRFLQQF